jgi:fucokinase
LFKWAQRTDEIVATVQSLCSNAREASRAIKDEDIDSIGSCLDNYWEQKKNMAGTESGVEPSFIANAIACLRQREAIRGASLCGAGGGGFMCLLLSENTSASTLASILAEELPNTPEIAFFTYHSCQVCTNGLTAEMLGRDWSPSDFSLAWHR